MIAVLATHTFGWMVAGVLVLNAVYMAGKRKGRS